MRILSFFILFILYASISFALCDNINMNILNVEKNESCYTSFSALFQDVGCEYNCFSNISNFVVMQGNNMLANRSGIITTYYSINLYHLDCTADKISLIIYDKEGQVSCKKDFSLQEVYELEQIPANTTPVIAQTPSEPVVSEQNNNPSANIQASSATPKQSIEANAAVQEAQVNNEVIINNNAVQDISDNTQNFQKPQETGRKNYTIPLLGLTAVILGLGVTLLILKKPRRKTVSRRKRR